MKIKKEFDVFMLHKITLEIIKLKCSVNSEKFPKKITIEDLKKIYFKNIKLKKNGEIMLTADSNFEAYTEKYKSTMLAELRYQIKERTKLLKKTKIKIHYNFGRF